MTDVAEFLHTRLAADPPPAVGPGVIATGWDAELDEQRELAHGGKELLAGIESTERDRTGISSLKIPNALKSSHLDLMISWLTIPKISSQMKQKIF